MMNVMIHPSESRGAVDIIGSKSYTHRALICAALSKGQSIVSNVSMNDDIFRTVSCLQKLGAHITVNDDVLIVDGFKDEELDEVVLDAHESGSTLRFLIPLASIRAKRVIFKGSVTLLNRNLSVYEELYQSHHKTFVRNKDHLLIEGFPELGDYRVDGSVSSQFISGLLFVLPLLNKESKITVVNELQSKPYVDLTKDLMKEFGINIKGLSCDSDQTYQSSNVKIEGDFSQAAFFAVLGAINNTVTINNLNPNSSQGDIEIFNILKNLGVNVSLNNNSYTVSKGNIKSGLVDLKHTPDLGPILFVLGLFSESFLVLENTERLKIKESDRVEAMSEALRKFGAHIEIFENSVIIHRLDKFNKVDCLIGHNDHRIVMALSILASTLEHPVSIYGASAIDKSYPKFFEDLNKLNVKTTKDKQ